MLFNVRKPHGDADHLGDALYLIDNLNVKSVMINKGNINDKEQSIIDSGIEVIQKYNGKLDLESLNGKDSMRMKIV